MKKLVAPLLVTCALFLAACGVDTTGLSAESSRPATGTESALVTITEYGDLQCPACKAAHEILTKPLLQKYDGRVRFVFKHFPLQAIHPHALEAAMASECAADQGKFWQFFEMTYQQQESMNSAAFREWAAELALDADLFDRCVRSGIKRKTVLADYAEGTSLGVNSTPTYFVNNTRVTNNTIESISTLIDAALQSAAEIPL